MITTDNRKKIIEQLIVLLPKLRYLDSPYGKFPTKGDGGDDCLWLGMLSSVGVPEAVNGVSECQSKEARNGMFYRNPYRRSIDNGDNGDFFSRDMATGVLTWFAKGCGTREQWAAWQNYWDVAKVCLKEWPWPAKGCMLWSKRFAPNDKCDITPVNYAMMGRICDHRGWPRNTDMVRYDKFDGDYVVQEAKVCTPGYELHLHACDAWIKRIIGQSKEYADKVSEICHERSPGNLFYTILAKYFADDADAAVFLDICSRLPDTLGNVWLWEVENPMDRIHDVCGWDLYFMGKLLLTLG